MVLLFFLVFSIQFAYAQQVLEKKTITMPSGHVLHVEVAKDTVHRALGLMYRKVLPKNHGMLFAFRDEQVRTFWMKDTRIPLSIAFLNKEGFVVKIADMQPLSFEAVSSDVPVQYALEVNQGAFITYKVVVGTTLVLPHIVVKE